MRMRAAVRTAFIVVFTAYLVALNGADILLPWHPFATFGFSADRMGVVTSADSRASANGLHTGDRLDVTRMPPAERVRVGYFSGAPDGRAALKLLSSGWALLAGLPTSNAILPSVTEIRRER